MAFNSNSGTTISAEDLLSKLNDFCVSNGFKTELFADNVLGGTTRGKRLHLSKNGKFYNFSGVSGLNPAAVNADTSYANIMQIASNISTDFSSSVEWYNNTNANGRNDIRSLQTSANATFFFYANDKIVIVVSKFNNSLYSYLIFGEMNCKNSNDSVHFVTASSYSYDFNSGQNNLLANDRIFKTTIANVNTNIIYNNTRYQLLENLTNNNVAYPSYQIPQNSTSNSFGVVEKATNSLTGTSVPFVIEFFDNDKKPVATINDLFYVNFDRITPEYEFNIGSSTPKNYKAFPFVQKRIPTDYSKEGNSMGILIKISG